MKVTSVKFEQLFTTGVYQNEKIGFEATLSDIERPQDVLETLRELAEQCHKKKYPYLYEHQITVNPEYAHLLHPNCEEPPYSIKTEKLTPKELQIQLHIDTINTYKDPVKLKQMFEKVSNSHPQIKEAYNKRLKELNIQP